MQPTTVNKGHRLHQHGALPTPKAEENEPVHRCRRSEKSYAERKLGELASHSIVPLRRELTSELRLSENTEPDTGQGRAKARQVSDPGTSQDTYG